MSGSNTTKISQVECIVDKIVLSVLTYLYIYSTDREYSSKTKHIKINKHDSAYNIPVIPFVMPEANFRNLKAEVERYNTEMRLQGKEEDASRVRFDFCEDTCRIGDVDYVVVDSYLVDPSDEILDANSHKVRLAIITGSTIHDVRTILYRFMGKNIDDCTKTETYMTNNNDRTNPEGSVTEESESGLEQDGNAVSSSTKNLARGEGNNLAAGDRNNQSGGGSNQQVSGDNNSISYHNHYYSTEANHNKEDEGQIDIRDIGTKGQNTTRGASEKPKDIPWCIKILMVISLVAMTIMNIHYVYLNYFGKNSPLDSGSFPFPEFLVIVALIIGVISIWGLVISKSKITHIFIIFHNVICALIFFDYYL